MKPLHNLSLLAFALLGITSMSEGMGGARIHQTQAEKHEAAQREADLQLAQAKSEVRKLEQLEAGADPSKIANKIAKGVESGFKAAKNAPDRTTAGTVKSVTLAGKGLKSLTEAHLDHLNGGVAKMDLPNARAKAAALEKHAQNEAQKAATSRQLEAASRKLERASEKKKLSSKESKRAQTKAKAHKSRKADPGIHARKSFDSAISRDSRRDSSNAGARAEKAVVRSGSDSRQSIGDFNRFGPYARPME